MRDGRYNVYVDGFNFYHSLQTRGVQEWGWVLSKLMALQQKMETVDSDQKSIMVAAVGVRFA